MLFSGPTLERPPAFEVQLSCFEVCGANCFDLLDNGEKLVVRESSSTKVEVRGLKNLLWPSMFSHSHWHISIFLSIPVVALYASSASAC